MDALEASLSQQSPGAEPLVSVLVLAYKQEDLVIECLESIRALDYPRLEVILSDDRSPDRTFEVAERWMQQNSSRFVRAIAFKQPNNLGVVGNLQFLFDQAAGEYVTYIASDDLYVSSAIHDRLAVFDQKPQLDAVFANAQEIAIDGTILKEACIPARFSEQFAIPSLLSAALVLNWCIPGPVMMVRRFALQPDGSLGRLPATLKGEDPYIYTRLAAKKKLAFIDKTVGKWRYVPHSLSHAPSPRNVFARGYTLESDKINRPLLRGFDRFALDIRIGSNKTEVYRRSLVPYIVKKVFYRGMMMLLRFALRLRTVAADFRGAASRHGARKQSSGSENPV
jgi:glycosyltransferase involved in cell wall biosynthesis